LPEVAAGALPNQRRDPGRILSKTKHQAQ
jgi:uncharacterized membrane protein